jgi:hypothetical protein
MALVLLPVSTEIAAAPIARDETGTLAACTPSLATAVLDRLAGDYLTTQVFLDFGRLFRPGRGQPGVAQRILLADLERHTRFLATSLERISAAYQAAGGRGALFVPTGDGALLVHAVTRLSIASVCRARPAQRLAA